MTKAGARAAAMLIKRLLWVGLWCLLLLLAPALPATAQDAEGQSASGQTFDQFCWLCHSKNGEGDGPMHTKFLPQPANLTLTRDTPAMYRSVIRHGIPGTVMPAFPELSEAQVEEAIEHFRGSPPATGREWSRPWTLPERNVSLETGQRLFTTACSGCHGPTGRGDGPWGADDHIWPKPANFQARNSVAERVSYVISRGRPGTMMPPQQLPELARWTMARYVAGLYDASSPAQMRKPENEPPRYRNPYSVADQQVVAAGKEKFSLYCSGCHGGGGRGSNVAPRLVDRDWYFGAGSDDALFSVLRKGVPGKVMIAFTVLPPEERWSIITFLRYQGGLPDPLYDLERQGGTVLVQPQGSPGRSP